jgi:hypothetical protein
MFIIQEVLCCHAIPSRETHVPLEMMGADCGATQLSNGLVESTYKHNFLDYVSWSSALTRESILLHDTAFPKTQFKKLF